MKVILLRDVAKLGKRFSIAEVPDGYALNKLIPSAIALAATPENLKRVQSRQAQQTAHKISEASDFKLAVAALKTTQVVVLAPSNEQNHLFKAVKAADIAQALATAGHPLPVESIKLTEPIKDLGDYEIPVAMGDVSDVIMISIKNK